MPAFTVFAAARIVILSPWLVVFVLEPSAVREAPNSSCSTMQVLYNVAVK
jgi:hypothetical protein